MPAPLRFRQNTAGVRDQTARSGVTKVMRAPLLIACALLIGTQAADARHYHWYHFHWRHSSHGALRTARAIDRGVTSASRSDRATRVLGHPFPPRDWQLQAADPNQKGRRYLAPSGEASVTFYAAPADQESVSAHLKSVAFGNGEQMLTITGGSDGLVVTGTHGGRMFLRKVRLACGGLAWHHITLEFPASARRDYALVSAQAVRAIDIADDDGCAEPIAGNER